METKFIKVRFGCMTSFIALYSGMCPAELSSLLVAVFRVQDIPIGFAEEYDNEIVVPLTLACQNPELLTAPVYQVLLTKGIAPWLQVSKQNSSGISSSSLEISGTNIDKEEDEESDEESSEDQEETVEGHSPQAARSEMLFWVDTLRADGYLTASETRILRSMALQDDRLVHSAVKVVASDGDLEFLVNLLKDIASNVMTESGREALACQRELLEAIDLLDQKDGLTPAECSHLETLVLVRSEILFAAWQVYRKDLNLSELFDTLQIVLRSYNSCRNQEKEEFTSKDENDFRRRQPANPTPELDFLAQLTENMAAQGLVASEEWGVLQEMINDTNPYIISAFELYEEDEDLEELMGTVARLAKVEMYRRGFPAAKTTARQKADAAIQRNKENERMDALMKEAGLDDSPEENDAAQRNSELPTEDVQQQRTETTTGSHSKYKVPGSYLKILSTASQSGLLSKAEERALIDAYAGYWESQGFGEMCRAAWEVFALEKDGYDMLDTLMRVSRRMAPALTIYADTEDEMPVENAKDKTQIQDEEEEDSEEEDDEDNSEEEENEEEREIDAHMQQLKSRTAEIEQRTSEILQSVISQCLEVMLPQGLLTVEEGKALVSLGQEARSECLRLLEAYKESQDLDALLLGFASIARAEVSGQVEESSTYSSSSARSSTKKSSSALADLHMEVPPLPNSVYAERVQKELAELVDCLGEDGKLTAKQVVVLMSCIRRNEPRVFAAHDTYVAFQDVDDLIDTLMRIAQKELQSRRAYPPEEGTGIEMINLSRAGDKAPKESRNEARLGLLTAQDRCDIITMMRDADVFTDLQAFQLSALVTKGSQEINDIFDEYEASKDVIKLVERVKNVSEEMPGKEESVVDDSLDEGDSDQEETDVEILDNHLYEILKALGLGRVETAALRLAVAKGDPNLTAVLEVYRLERDPADLLDSLRRIVRTTLAGIDLSQDARPTESTKDSENKRSTAKVSPQPPKEGMTADTWEIQERFDIQRKTIFDLLTSELVKAKLLFPNQEKMLQELYNKRDSVLMAAFDVYEIESNLEEFVDTLKRIVSRFAK